MEEIKQMIKKLKVLKKKAEKQKDELRVISIEAAIRSLQIIVVWEKLN